MKGAQPNGQAASPSTRWQQQAVEKDASHSKKVLERISQQSFPSASWQSPPAPRQGSKTPHAFNSTFMFLPITRFPGIPCPASVRSPMQPKKPRWVIRHRTNADHPRFFPAKNITAIGDLKLHSILHKDLILSNALGLLMVTRHIPNRGTCFRGCQHCFSVSSLITNSHTYSIPQFRRTNDSEKDSRDPDN